jgi:hypothetical protein
MPKNASGNAVQGGKQIEQDGQAAGMRGATDKSALRQKPQEVANPDKLGNTGAGVFKNPDKSLIIEPEL